MMFYFSNDILLFYFNIKNMGAPLKVLFVSIIYRFVMVIELSGIQFDL